MYKWKKKYVSIISKLKKKQNLLVYRKIYHVLI